MADMPGMRVEIAFETDPLVRPGPTDWTRIDTVTPMRRLTTVRGARMQTGQIEAGTATALIDNRSRALEPGFAGSPWAPNVRPRRRIRFIMEPVGDTPREVFTGFIDKLPINWHIEDAWVELEAVDLFALLADINLPDSAFHHEMRTGPAPTHWWPLDSNRDRIAEDLIGGRPGRFSFDAQPATSPLLRFTPGEAFEFFGNEEDQPWTPGQSGHVVTIRDFAGGGGYPVVVDVWVRMTRPPTPIPLGGGSNLWANARAWYRRNPGPSTQREQLTGIWFADDPALHGRPFFVWSDLAEPSLEFALRPSMDGTPEDWAQVPSLADGNPHHLRVVLTEDPFFVDEITLTLYVDGRTYPVLTKMQTWGAIPDFDSDLTLGWHNFTSAGAGFAGAGLTSHAAWWSDLSSGDLAILEGDDHWQAGAHAWAGETTGERVDRVLDAAGIDLADRDIDAGTERVGPAIYDGQPVRTYLRRVAATEQGSLLVAPDGRITFRQRLANDPPADFSLSGAPGPSVIPYSGLELEHSVDSLINVVDATVDGRSGTVRHVDPGSVAAYGPASLRLSTAAVSRLAAASLGGRIVARAKDARTVIRRVELASLRDDVPLSVSLDAAVRDVATVVATPPGPGDPIEQLSLVDRIEHRLDWHGRQDWRTRLGLSEVVVLPTLAWDTAGRGWDESVWAEET